MRGLVLGFGRLSGGGVATAPRSFVQLPQRQNFSIGRQWVAPLSQTAVPTHIINRSFATRLTLPTSRQLWSANKLSGDVERHLETEDVKALCKLRALYCQPCNYQIASLSFDGTVFKHALAQDRPVLLNQYLNWVLGDYSAGARRTYCSSHKDVLVQSITEGNQAMTAVLLDHGFRIKDSLEKWEDASFGVISNPRTGRLLLNTLLDNPALFRTLVEEGGLDVDGSYGCHFGLKYGAQGCFSAYAAESGSLPALELLHELGADLNQSLPRPPLEYALERDHRECAKFLILNGAKFESCTASSLPYVLDAIPEEKLFKLLDQGTANYTDLGRFLLQRAIRKQDHRTVVELIEEGFSVTGQTVYRESMLVSAVKQDNLNIVRAVVEAGADDIEEALAIGAKKCVSSKILQYLGRAATR